MLKVFEHRDSVWDKAKEDFRSCASAEKNEAIRDEIDLSFVSMAMTIKKLKMFRLRN